MKRPKVLLENAPEIYQAYGDTIRPNRMVAMGASALIASVLRPRVHYASGAKDQLREIIKSRERPAILMANHQDEKDPFVLTGAAWRSVLWPATGKVRTAAKDDLFPDGNELFSKDGLQRRYLDTVGCFPVFRGDKKHHGPGAVKLAWPPMREFCISQLAAGKGLAFFGEGTCNDTNPTRVQKIQLGAAHIAIGAMAQGVDPVFILAGIHYGPREIPAGRGTLPELTLAEARGASVVFGPPVDPVELVAEFEQSGVPKGAYAKVMTERLHGDLQDALDLAVKLHE